MTPDQAPAPLVFLAKWAVRVIVGLVAGWYLAHLFCELSCVANSTACAVCGHNILMLVPLTFAAVYLALGFLPWLRTRPAQREP